MNSAPQESLLKKFFLELSKEIRTDLEGEPDKDQRKLDVAVGRAAIDLLEEEGIVAEPLHCPFADITGRRRSAINAVAFNEGSDRLDLFIATARDLDEIGWVSATELADLAGRAAKFFDYAARKDWDRFTTSSETLDAARQIHSALEGTSQVRIYLLTNGRAREKFVESLSILGKQIAFEVVDVERLFRLSQTATSRQDIEVDFVALSGRPLACLEMTPRSPEYDTYLAIFPGQLLCDLYEKFGQRLFEFNVRSFLQAKGKVNKGIRDTLRDQPDRFLAFNNGLVATADHLDVGLRNGEMTISKMVGLQIVNGAQTTASIHRARKVDKIDLSQVSVAVKITKVAPEKLHEMVPLLSRFANTQNTIQIADLSANNEFHIEIERLSEQIWCPGEDSRWFYERARGAYQDALAREGSTNTRRREFQRQVPASQKLTKTDLAKYFMAWIGRPHSVSLGAQKNFSIFMSELSDFFPAGWKPDKEFFRRIVGQAILFRACEKAVRAHKFPAYRANIVCYAFSLISHRAKGEFDFESIWDSQAVSTQLGELCEVLTKHVDQAIRSSAGAKNITEWCKKSDCWEAVRSADFSMPQALPAEFLRETEADTSRRLNDAAPQSEESTREWDDEEAIAECMRHDAATWAKLNFWGLTTRSLDYYERGVAHTLSEYAASSWVRKPSVKQARIGMRVIRRGREENLI